MIGPNFSRPAAAAAAERLVVVQHVLYTSAIDVPREIAHKLKYLILFLSPKLLFVRIVVETLGAYRG